MTLEVIIFSVIGFLGSIVGNFIGKRVFGKLNAHSLRRLIYLGMIISGITMIV